MGKEALLIHRWADKRAAPRQKKKKISVREEKQWRRRRRALAKQAWDGAVVVGRWRGEGG